MGPFVRIIALSLMLVGAVFAGRSGYSFTAEPITIPGWLIGGVACSIAALVAVFFLSFIFRHVIGLIERSKRREWFKSAIFPWARWISGGLGLLVGIAFCYFYGPLWGGLAAAISFCILLFFCHITVFTAMAMRGFDGPIDGDRRRVTLWPLT